MSQLTTEFYKSTQKSHFAWLRIIIYTLHQATIPNLTQYLDIYY